MPILATFATVAVKLRSVAFAAAAIAVEATSYIAVSSTTSFAITTTSFAITSPCGNFMVLTLAFSRSMHDAGT